MKFSTRHDIDAPIEYVFQRITDFETLERQALRRGAGVSRKDPSFPRGVGMEWDIEVPFRGKVRKMSAELTKLEAPTSLEAKAESDGLNMTLDIELVALSRARTRMVLGYDVRPKTLAGRIIIRSVKFAKGTMDRRFERKVAAFCEGLSDNYSKMRKA
ncbi:SRPBCC family protein [Celeribacter sp.]|uniref:SRPBCC family protein n=1 Tax=Celeribacter sp. TaxID=1890673 RepID=UPI003A921238